ncbi:lipase [Streptomyces malaysiensis subsp. malaysiensis]|uniref:lipase family protein n=1 Tax=Streptomyces malaysiensis TaxID=92644 RepID=UPI000BFDE94F|nr:lipase family protein [Streptomyces malaysiensis]ATL84581.1 triacylglycerol lipase [Streptomyces malaysiensis]QDL71520.1 lipase [Streptomyces malaysiensis]
MRIRTTVLAALAALTLASASPAAPAAAASSDTPAADTGRPGDIVTSAPTAFRTLPGVPTATRAWHITYRSTTATGRPDIVSGTVVVPDDGTKGPRPLIAWGIGAVGLADGCAVSGRFPQGASSEAQLIDLALRRGWAVAVTDYEGLGTPDDHTYTVGRSEGQAVLDAARAAQRLPEAGLSPDAPVGIMGYSQGGQAAGWAAELHPSYAPELRVKGTVAGGVPADLPTTFDYNDGGAGAGLALMALAGQDSAFPALRLDSYLNDRGRGYVDFMKRNCVSLSTIAGLFQHRSEVTVRDPLADPVWQLALRASLLGTRSPDHPVYLYQGRLDELIPYRVGEALRDRWCARGVPVEWQDYPLDHVTTALTGMPMALDWMAGRLADEPTRGNCGA